MTADLLLALVAFSFVTSATPGPNNAMVLASGATFGLRRTVPHMLGIAVGVVVMITAVGLGLGSVFRSQPRIYDALQIVGAMYLLVLAWRIARSGGPAEATDGAQGSTAKPLGFLGAAGFQWVNPKAWVMVAAAVTTYAPQEGYAGNVLIVAAVFGIVCLPSVALWASMGAGLARALRDPGRVRWINRGMAVLLVLSLVPLVAELVG